MSNSREDQARGRDAGDEPCIDDNKPISEREEESKRAGKYGSNLPGTVEIDGQKRLINDMAEPGMDIDRTMSMVDRPMRTKDDIADESYAPVPPPERDDPPENSPVLEEKPRQASRDK
jgi:hypothetical protein